MGRETVLVTDGQLRSALAVVRSLGKREGITVICGESTRFATAFYSRYVNETVVYPAPEREPERFASFLRSFVASRDVDAVLPVGHETTELVSRHHDVLSRYTDLPVPPFDRFQRGWDKGETLRAADRASVPHPKTAIPSSTTEAVDRADEIGYPLVVKARTSAGSRGLRFVEHRSSFVDAYEAVDESYPEPLVQERVPQEGRMFGAAFLYNDESELRAQFACEFRREYPPSGGPSTYHTTVDRENILDYGRRLLKELDWRGIALVEFKLDPEDGTPQLMEINPRFWSSLHLALYAGVDFPWLVLRYAHGDDPPRSTGYEVGVTTRYLLPGDLLRLATVRDREAVREFFPLREEGVRYEIPCRRDKGPTVGRLLAMSRYAASPRMWRRVIVRN